jgi:DNA repair exonuclease SbcCD ATPase subunit
VIKFTRVTYKNLLSVGNVPITIDLDEPGSYLIIGKNGVGKSLLGEAITYALYGWPYRKIKKTQLVNSINKKDLLVELDFITNGKVYRIRRGMKPNVFEVFCNGKLLNQDGDSRDYQRELEEKILRMNYEAFKQIVLLSKTDYKPFMELKANERRDVIEKLLDIQIFTIMGKILKMRREDAQKELDRVENKIESTADTVKRIRANIARFMQNTDDMVSAKEGKIKTLKEEALTAFNQLNTIKADLERVQGEYESISTTTKTKREKAVQLRNKIIDRQRNVSRELEFFEHTSNCPTCEQTIDTTYRENSIQARKDTLADLEGALQQIDDRLRAIASQQEHVKELDSEQRKLQNASIELRSTIKHTRTTIESLNEELEQLRNQQSQYTQEEDEIKELESVLRGNVKEKKKLLGTLELYKVATMLLKDTGIKAQIIKQSVPLINKFVAKYLSAMDFFVQFELDENFEEVIKSRFRDEFSYHSFSEGEKFRIDLSLLLTWRAVARLRNSCTTNLLFLDEIFDSSLDTGGVEDFMKLLDALVSEGITVMVVSHRGDQLVDKFENIIKFDKVKNFTQLVEQ